MNSGEVQQSKVMSTCESVSLIPNSHVILDESVPLAICECALVQA